MAYQPPYGYGGGNYPPYGSSAGGGYGGQNREAMLRVLTQPDNPNYQYPQGGQLKNVSTQTGLGSSLTDTAVKTGLGVAPIGVATEFAGAALKPKGQAATASPYGDLTDQYTRRMEGGGEGIAGGAVKWGGRGAQAGMVLGGPVGAGIGAGVGALAGAIGGAFTKNAKSAYSDFRTQDAVEAIRNMYKTRGGRLPTEAEVEQILIGQGMDPQSARTHTGVVGEKGLYSVLHSLDQNFAKERAALVAQAAGGGTGGATSEYGTTDVNLTPEARAKLLADTAQSQRAAMPQVEPNAARLGRVDPQADISPGGVSGPMTPQARAELMAAAAQARGGMLPGGMTGRPGELATGGAPSGIPPGTPPPQAPPVVPQSGAPPAPPAAPPAPSLPANADTDGYAKPAYTAAQPSGSPPPGWDSKKWSDPAHQTPKYIVGRIMSQFAPTTENMPKVLAEIQKAYPGTTMVGKDSINIPGVGTTDVLRAADVGGKGWQWLGSSRKQGGGGSGAGGGGTGATGAGYNAGGDVAGGDVINQIIANLGGIAGGGGAQNAGPVSVRDSLIAQLGIR